MGLWIICPQKKVISSSFSHQLFYTLKTESLMGLQYISVNVTCVEWSKTLETQYKS